MQWESAVEISFGGIRVGGSGGGGSSFGDERMEDVPLVAYMFVL